MKNMPEYKDIDEYIAFYPQDVQEKLQKIRKLIHEEAPEATEAISYGIPTFKLFGKNLVHFGGFKEHISFFPTSSPFEHFKEELKDYATTNGTIQFPNDKEIPYDLIKKITQFRIQEYLARHSKKNK